MEAEWQAYGEQLRLWVGHQVDLHLKRRPLQVQQSVQLQIDDYLGAKLEVLVASHFERNMAQSDSKFSALLEEQRSTLSAQLAALSNEKHQVQSLCGKCEVRVSQLEQEWSEWRQQVSAELNKKLCSTEASMMESRYMTAVKDSIANHMEHFKHQVHFLEQECAELRKQQTPDGDGPPHSARMAALEGRILGIVQDRIESMESKALGSQSIMRARLEAQMEETLRGLEDVRREMVSQSDLVCLRRELHETMTEAFDLEAAAVIEYDQKLLEQTHHRRSPRGR